MLTVRIITVLGLLLVFLPLTFWAPSVWIHAVFLLVAALGAWEWARLAGVSNRRSWWGALACAAAILALWWVVQPSTIMVVGLTSLIFWIWVGVRWLPLGVPMFVHRQPLWLVLMGLMILLALWEGAYAALTYGPWFLISVMSVVWISDIAAYFVGRAIGRHKLAPQISPGKTWEGVAGAIGASLLVAMCLGQADFARTVPNFYTLIYERLGLWWASTVIVGLVVLGIIGDLFESQLKRRIGVKDSSHLLPGHGGILDRLDALLPTVPAAMLLEYLTR